MFMKKVTVRTETSNYPIYIGRGLFSGRNFNPERLKSWLGGSKVCVVTNITVRGLYGELVEAFFEGFDVTFFEIEDGEQYKSFITYQAIIDFLISKKFDRTLNLIALGGGVVGDLCGFVSATYLRGVNFIQIPTTLLAQVDSSVGGKTGINHPAGKNLVGAFYQPSLVLIDSEMLVSLPKREYLAGLAEVVKYGLIYDESFFSWIESKTASLEARELSVVTDAIVRSCEIKSEIVSLDEREMGMRAILNFGHTFGHAIETVSGYGAWLHGEAVSIGIEMACALSFKMDLLKLDSFARVKQTLSSLGLPIAASNLSHSHIDPLIDAIKLDKKVKDGRLNFISIQEIGKVRIEEGVSEDDVRGVLAQALPN